MSFVSVNTDFVSQAAGNLARVGSLVSEANSTAAAQTTAITAAGADEVSRAVAAVFGAHAQTYQSLSAQATVFHDEFVRVMSGNASAYATAEATNLGPLQPVLDLINAPTRAIFNRPLIGDGRAGAPGMPGEDGGILFGNGGAGGAALAGNGGKGGSALFFGNGGAGGQSGPASVGGAGGNGGYLLGNGGAGGVGFFGGGAGGRAWFIGDGGSGGATLSLGNAGNGGAGGFLYGGGGNGGNGGSNGNGGNGGDATLFGNGGNGGHRGVGGTDGLGGRGGLLFGMSGSNGVV